MKTLLTGLLIGGVALAAEAPKTAAVRDAVQRGVGLLEKTSPNFIKRGGCNSCHNQFLPAAAQAIARDHGIAVGKEFTQLPVEAREEPPDRLAELIATGGSNSVGYQMFTDAALKRPADARSAALVHYLFATQSPDGRWQTAGNRPPMTFDDFNTTAFAIFALREYATESQKAEAKQRIDRARAWLLEAKPSATQERAFHLLGLGWSSAARDAIAKSAKGLAGTQRADGGWSQLPTMETDAYATGEALYALHEVAGQVNKAGTRYLLETQAADGSWHVVSRAAKFQPYFESGFPYGGDQWISSAATAWATTALSYSASTPQIARR